MPSASFVLPVDTGTASFWPCSGTLLAGSETGKSEGFEMSEAASSNCMTSLRTSCSDMPYIFTENFDSEDGAGRRPERKIFFCSAISSLYSSGDSSAARTSKMACMVLPEGV